MNDWADDLADKVKKQQEQKTADDAKFLEIRGMKAKFGPDLWDGLVAEVKDRCAAMNRRVGNDVAVVEDAQKNNLSVRNGDTPGRKLNSRFNVERAEIVWEAGPLLDGGSAQGRYEVSVDPKDGKASRLWCKSGFVSKNN